MIKNTVELEVNPENIGAFIGASGKNFKKFISHIKKEIIGRKTEISPEEWSEIKFDLKFEKKESTIEAIFEFEEEHVEKVKQSLLHFVKLHDAENKKHENKKEFFSDAYLKRFLKDNLATSS